MKSQINLEKDMNNYKYLIFLEINGFNNIYENFGYLEALRINNILNKELNKFKSKNFQGYQSIKNRFTILTNNMKLFFKFLKNIKNQIPEYMKIENFHFNSGVLKIKKHSNNLSNIQKANATLLLAIKQNKEILYFSRGNKDIKYFINEEKWKLKTLSLIKNNLIIPYYQPILNIKTGKIEKYEVLARGKLKDKIAQPFEFLPAAHRLEMLPIITKMIIEESFKYFSKNKFSFSINITESDLVDPNFVDFLVEKANEYNISTERITLEFLENIKHSEIIIFKSNLDRLKMLNFNLAIDDFGIEYSNLSRIKILNCSLIKIDSEFIKDIHINENNRSIVKYIVNLSKELNIKTVAEFVENEEIFNVVKDCGIDYAQGYYIGRPLEKIIP